ncbi:caspase family protein [Thiococcus pfennigii]|uniref:caspase family protein n=1 Tax=Thiococcus pfennigii TaxID=1057 RepID=UPI00190560B8|nr:caspase family protein [Thiococcus pfennigii]MBK1730878.1 peptidase C14 caspase catalytic subunit p20 [Thiococcus pfennigii]
MSRSFVRYGLAIACGVLWLLTAGCQDEGGPASSLPAIGCDPDRFVETDGQRRVALLVGVGQYRNELIPDLKGPPNDARLIYDLLTGPNGYGFPKENVCVLIDGAATTDAFREAFERLLVERARAQDVAVLFFAGHGSQTRSLGDDEPDGWDETLLFHDSRVGTVRDLVDDELNAMLARLHAKTRNLTAIVDACNSGTVTRAPEAGTTMARFFTPMDETDGPIGAVSEGGDASPSWVPASLPGLVALTAASDGNPALEKDGRGLFTAALAQVLAQVGDRPLTYAQVARQVPPLLAAESPQIPYFQGDLRRAVFGKATRERPIGWEVRTVGDRLELAGPPLPGVGPGAEFRIYGGGVAGAEAHDPGRAKGTAVVVEMQGVNAWARVTAVDAARGPMAPGDLAVLVRPQDGYTQVRVRLRPADEPGGLPAERADALRRSIQADPDARLLVEPTDGAGDFELSLDASGRLLLRGPENRIRTRYERDQAVPRNLWQHARIRALTHLRGEGGADFVNQETLQARLVPAPAARQVACARGVWVQAEPNQEQVVPLCHAWNLEVTLDASAPVPLLIGALVLSSDGGLFALPVDRQTIRLGPGERHLFAARGETFQGVPPIDVVERILVFGTQETNPVPWHLFAEEAAVRQGVASAGLYRALDRYLTPGTRGAAPLADGPIEDTTWTLSSVAMRVEANYRFLASQSRGAAAIDRREYTIADFDLRPYLPDARDSALHQVLAVADWLARSSAEDGFSYKQHAWNKGSDRENLQLGIDCSRAIWFAFTRAGWPYNRDDRYLTTAQMVGDGSPMADRFDSCLGDPALRIGDLLVYRDPGRGDGHVVMVIDPDKRIAWGSHGWDGTPRDLPVEPDTGVEYQKIKYKPDWRRWDRATMELAACWRYRTFAEEHRTGRGMPGSDALISACDPNRRCGNP